MKQPIKVIPGSDEHLALLMSPWSLDALTEKGRADILAWGRRIWDSAQHEQTALKSVIAAWEYLPGNQRYSASEISNWLSGPMAEAIDLARAQISAMPLSANAVEAAMLEKVAVWYSEHGWLLDEGDVADAIRRL